MFRKQFEKLFLKFWNITKYEHNEFKKFALKFKAKFLYKNYAKNHNKCKTLKLQKNISPITVFTQKFEKKDWQKLN